MSPIFTYLVNRMQANNDSYEAVIIASILEQMFGWKDLQIDLLNDKQLYSLAGKMWLKLDS
jgi:hypothetical protein